MTDLQCPAIFTSEAGVTICTSLTGSFTLDWYLAIIPITAVLWFGYSAHRFRWFRDITLFSLILGVLGLTLSLTVSIFTD